ncbi:hypothetical protein CPBF424_06640 [Xanthomonas euroxanthea]|uniref:Uncharacterized protein n=1 Tax=Xanthomonas euroxanthea TaxID=2259622 RepID=A0AA46C5S9_9XANT|nr:hypothetical protein CPBF424_06640 [Xanthomonas euroxanthea]
MCPVCMPPSGSSHVPGARGSCQLLQGGEPAVVQAALGAMHASFCKAADKWPGSQANASAPACCEGARSAVRGLAAGPLPAHHRRTRRKYVLVGSGAASMPLKVPRRWAGKDQSRWRCVWCKQGMACVVRITLRPISAPCKPSGRQASNTQPANVSSAHRMSSNTFSRKQPTNCLVRCPRRSRDRVAAWRPPPSPQGGVHGVSRER